MSHVGKAMFPLLPPPTHRKLLEMAIDLHSSGACFLLLEVGDQAAKLAVFLGQQKSFEV